MTLKKKQTKNKEEFKPLPDEGILRAINGKIVAISKEEYFDEVAAYAVNEIKQSARNRSFVYKKYFQCET